MNTPTHGLYEHGLHIVLKPTDTIVVAIFGVDKKWGISVAASSLHEVVVRLQEALTMVSMNAAACESAAHSSSLQEWNSTVEVIAKTFINANDPATRTSFGPPPCNN